MTIIVSDTSPIRALAHLHLLELLGSLFHGVVVPPAVVSELEQPRPRFVPIDVRAISSIRVQSPRDRTLVEQLRGTLGAGEAEAIVLSEELQAEAILIDESAGRAVAVERGLRPIGVIGILLRAKRRGLIPEVSCLLERLRSELGFFLSHQLVEQALRQAGELG